MKSSWFKRNLWERHMHAEFQSHLENQINDYMQKGLTREAAEARARREFGSIQLAKDECRDERAFEPFDRLLRDVRYASRSLIKTPAYSITAILTLALGIGPNTAIFSALDGVVLQPLPYHEPDRLVLAALYNRALKHGTDVSYPDFLDWQRDARCFKQIAAFMPTGFDLTNPGVAEHVDGYQISAGFFDTLGVNLAIGRSFSPAEDRTGGMAAAIISHRLWQERFHGSPSAIGQSVTLNGSGYTVVGVLPQAFRFEDQLADVFTTLGRGDQFFLSDRTIHSFLCIARLTPGVTLGQAQAELNTLQQHIDALNPATERGQGTIIVPLKQELVGDISSTFVLLLGAVGVVLLIACANVANLLLARSATRNREFAVRRALGAGRAQIIGQIITESVLLSCAGGVLGLATAKFGLAALLRSIPVNLPRIENIGINASVLLFVLGVSVIVGFLFALAPALKYASTDLQTSIREGGRGSTGGHQGTQAALAIAQVALALVLLSGAGLLFRTIHNLWKVKPGFDTQHVITFQAGLATALTQTPAATRAAYQQITDKIRQLPGVEAADLTALVPLGRGDNSGPFWIGPHPPLSMAEIPRATYYAIGSDYPPTLQIPLLRGRLLRQSDNIHSELVVLIDDLMAHKFFANSDPLGKSITFPHWGHMGATSLRIVGVLGHVKQYGIDGSGVEKPQIYYSFYQLPDDALPVFRNAVTFAVRSRLNAGELTPEIKNAVHAMSNDLPIYNVRTMRDLVSGSMSHQRFAMILLVAFAILALLLATIGIYGVISYLTSQRIPEIGVRMALGAARWDVLRMLVGHGVRLAIVGIAIGTVAAVALTRVLSSFSRLLYGVRKTDPFTFVAVSACLLLAVLLACYIPARRAARLDPMIALRHE